MTSPRTAFLPALAAGLLLSACALSPLSSKDDGPPVISGQPGVMPPVEVTELAPSPVTALDAPIDLWDRIRRGFALPDLDTELVQKQQDWYLQRPDYIERMVGRSRLYLFHVVEQLELRDMPTELALLPYIESAFNPQAVSSARAAGMWQFMPRTGAAFELHQNSLRDDRRDILASTSAALDYLQQLHARFGDWHLALAAYNWGQGNVGRAITRNQTAGLGTGYLDLDMPDETRNYVPKLQAVKNIIANPDELGASLPVIGNHPFFDTVDIVQDIDVDVAARLAGVPLDDFRALNPSQHKPIIFAAGTPQVLLPWDNAVIFQENLAQADPASLASWTTWVAPANLRLSQIAQRVGMPEPELRKLNGVPANALIRKGSTLLVPRPEHALAAVSIELVNNARLNYGKPVVRRTVVRARRGDTVARLASRYDLPAATVARWNKLRPQTRLAQGRSMVVYLPVDVAPQASARKAAPRRAARRR